MKKLKIAGMILTSFFSVTAFAVVNTGLTFDLSNQDQPDAQGDNHYFSCNMTKDNGTLLSPTKVTFTIEGSGIIFNKGNKSIENMAVTDLAKDYLGVKKDQRGEGTVFYSTNNGSELICAKTKNGRGEEYTK